MLVHVGINVLMIYLESSTQCVQPREEKNGGQVGLDEKREGCCVRCHLCCNPHCTRMICIQQYKQTDILVIKMTTNRCTDVKAVNITSLYERR